jgi:hypothetical protein
MQLDGFQQLYFNNRICEALTGRAFIKETNYSRRTMKHHFGGPCIMDES